MNIAVVGAGIYGVSIALDLAKDHHHVQLFDKNDDILMGASMVNQLRLHRGYHYPRCDMTMRSCKTSEQKFRETFKDAIVDGDDHYYVLAKKGSFMDKEEFLKQLQKHDIWYEEGMSPIVDPDTIQLSVKVEESRIHYRKLKEICWKRLKASPVRMHLGTLFKPSMVDDFDVTVVCTYGIHNHFMDHHGGAKRNYQWELVEKIVVELPEEFKGQSVVVMDGPFSCVDPLDDTKYHLLGNVVHAIHATNVGERPVYDEKYEPFINNGVIADPPYTNFDKFIESSKEFFPSVTAAKHIGSMYTFRVVLPNVEKTDSRPTIVEKTNDKIITVFSGKISNCVDAAKDVSHFLGNKR